MSKKTPLVVQSPLISNHAPGPRHVGCGDCRACCSCFNIEELNKPDYVPCSHLVKDNENGGCGIYATRPKSCQDFHCLWVQGLLYAGKEKYRPDQLGIVFWVMEIPPMNGMLGAFPTKRDGNMSPFAKRLLWEIQKTTLYFDGFTGMINGPQRLINEWKAKWFFEKVQKQEDYLAPGDQSWAPGEIK